MSLNKDLSQKQKLTEQFQTLCTPRQRTKETACQLSNRIQVKKLSIDNLPRYNQPVVLGENSLKFGLIKNQFHTLEYWDYQNSQPRIQR